MSKAVVVVGASMSGLRIAESLRRFGYLGPIRVFGNEPHPPYNRPPLSKNVLASQEVELAEVAFPQRSATADVEWNLGVEVVAANLQEQTITVAHGGRVPFDQLVVATGLRPKRLDFEAFSDDRFVLRTLDEAKALRKRLLPGRDIVIVGSGFIACEVAATATKLGCRVQIVSPSKLPMDRALGDELSLVVIERLLSEGISFHMERTLVELVGDTHLQAVILSDGSTLTCDTLIEAIGSEANTEWLSGNDLDLSDGLLCDSKLRAVRPSGGAWVNVFGLGDVARFPNPIFDSTPRRVEHWNIPTESAKFVGQRIAAGMSNFDTLPEVFRPLPSFWSDQFDMHIFGLGLPHLSDSSTLVHGDSSGDCVFEYSRKGVLVAVVGIGHRSVVQNYRATLER